METVTFPARHYDIVADVRFPEEFDKSKKYPAIIVAHPISSVKEQTSGPIYGAQMTQRGFITLAFDAGYQGASGGEPRYVEDSASRVEDFSYAVDYLVTLSYVDENRIGVIGMCGGGGYAANAALTEKRIRAVGLVVPVNFGRVTREGDTKPDAAIRQLKALADQRTKEARIRAKDKKDDPLLLPYVPFDSHEQRENAGVEDPDIKGAVDFYLTPRAQHKNSTNKFRFTSTNQVYAWDAFHLAESLFTQPLHVVIGAVPGAFGSFRDGHEIYYRARTTEKSLQILPNTEHYDLYDGKEATAAACTELGKFFSKYLN